jgi:hypothetical protein
VREALSCSSDTGGDCGKTAGEEGATSAMGRAAAAGSPSAADAGCVMLADSVVAAAAATG